MIKVLTSRTLVIVLPYELAFIAIATAVARFAPSLSLCFVILAALSIFVGSRVLQGGSKLSLGAYYFGAVAYVLISAWFLASYVLTSVPSGDDGPLLCAGVLHGPVRDISHFGFPPGLYCRGYKSSGGAVLGSEPSLVQELWIGLVTLVGIWVVCRVVGVVAEWRASSVIVEATEQL